jgi:hypothetical protein
MSTCCGSQKPKSRMSTTFTSFAPTLIFLKIDEINRRIGSLASILRNKKGFILEDEVREIIE